MDPATAGFKLQEPREPFDLAQALTSIAAAADLEGAITAVEPVFYHYKLLKDALARYRKIALEAPATALPPVTASLKVGDRYAGAGALRHLLDVLGDLPPGAQGAQAQDVFDPDLSRGVRAFQERHGLSADGALGKGTLRALQTPIAHRIRQISLTLERWRWLAPFKTPPIIVNIPEFRLFAFRTTEDRVADILQMEVIVGRTFASAQTPVFEDNMRYVVLRPYWDVPYNITKRELLPKIHANPGYLSRERLELVNGQGDNSPVVPPTPENLELLAAGKLRPAAAAGRRQRARACEIHLSEQLQRLPAFDSRTPVVPAVGARLQSRLHPRCRSTRPRNAGTEGGPGDWTREKIDTVMHGTADSVRVNLTQPIQVLILYATALATEAGPVYFFDDIYGYDRKLEGQLGLAAVR